MEDPRDVHAHRTLLRPVVHDDVRPARLVLVRAHHDLDPRRGRIRVRARIGKPGERPPAVEGGRDATVEGEGAHAGRVAPRLGRGVAKERITVPYLAAELPNVPNHASPG